MVLNVRSEGHCIKTDIARNIFLFAKNDVVHVQLSIQSLQRLIYGRLVSASAQDSTPIEIKINNSK